MSNLSVSFCVFRAKFFSVNSLISHLKVLFRFSSWASRLVIDDIRSESFCELARGIGLGGYCDARGAPTLGTRGDRCCYDPLISLLFSRGLLTIGIPPAGTSRGLLG